MLIIFQSVQENISKKENNPIKEKEKECHEVSKGIKKRERVEWKSNNIRDQREIKGATTRQLSIHEDLSPKRKDREINSQSIYLPKKPLEEYGKHKDGDCVCYMNPVLTYWLDSEASLGPIS